MLDYRGFRLPRLDTSSGIPQEASPIDEVATFSCLGRFVKSSAHNLHNGRITGQDYHFGHKMVYIGELDQASDDYQYLPTPFPFTYYSEKSEETMLLDSYKANELMWLTNVHGATSDAGTFVFRGDLVIEEGTMIESAGKRNPPISVIQSSVVLADENKIKMVVGFFENLETLPKFVERFKGDFAPDMVALIYVENIDKPMQVELEGVKFPLVPFSSGMVWNTLLDDLYLEKADLKGQSAEDKVVTVYESLKGYKPAGDVVSMDEALSRTIVVEKSLSSGPV